MRRGGVEGEVSPQEALAKLLDGTGLTFRAAGTATITLVNPRYVQLDAPEREPGGVLLDELSVAGFGRERGDGPVRGYVAKRTSTGTKTDTLLVENPQSISVITADQVADQAAQSLGDTLRYTPGTRGDLFGVSTTRDIIRIRGFNPNFFLDGLQLPYGITAQGAQSEPYGLERIEVLRGPSSVLYGQNPPGGIINMVSKRPTETPRKEVFIQGGSYGRLQGGFDVSGPIAERNDILYRVVGLIRNSGTQVDFADDDRYFIAPSFTWKPSNQTSLTVLGQSQLDQAGIIDQYLPASSTLYPNKYGKFRYNTNVGEPSLDKIVRRFNTIGYIFEHQFENDMKFRQVLRYESLNVRNHSTWMMQFLPDTRSIDRNFGTIHRKASIIAIDNNIMHKFTTGQLEHNAIIGADYRNESARSLNGGATAPPIDLFKPVYNLPLGTYAVDAWYGEKLSALGIYAQDQIRIDRWLLTASGRTDWATTATVDYLNTTNSKVHDRASTGRIGIGYTFDNGLVPYMTYATSFEPILNVTSPARGSVSFRPTTGVQHEAGIKYQPSWLDGILTAAVFDIKQANVETIDPDDFRYTIQTGEVRSRGLELEARLNIGKNWSAIGAYTYLDTKVTKSNDPDQLGRQLQHVAPHQASLWITRNFDHGPLNGFRLGAGVRYTAPAYGDAANLVRVPEYTLFDALLSVDLSKYVPRAEGTTLQINATNLFDKKVVSVCWNLDTCSLGQRRTILATLKYQW